MLIKAFVSVILLHQTVAAWSKKDPQIVVATNEKLCPAAIYKKCKLDEYLISTLEIIDREIGISKSRADDYFKRQICSNAHEEMIKFKKCVFHEVGHNCWTWDGVFDSIRLLFDGGEQDPILAAVSKRYEQIYVFLEYNLCGDTERRHEYFEIRSCSHKRFTASGLPFHERFATCLANQTPNEIQEAMNKMDLCVGHNREYACFVDSMLGDGCDKIKDALLTYSKLHSGHGGMHDGEISELQFILQSAYSDHLRLPKHDECHLLKKRTQGHGTTESLLYYGIILAGFGVLFYFAYKFKDDIVSRFK